MPPGLWPGSHSQCFKLGSIYSKTRLLALVRSQATSFERYYSRSREWPTNIQSYRSEGLWPLTLYEVHRHGSFPSEADGNPHIELPRRLADAGKIRTGISHSQRAATWPLGAPHAGMVPDYSATDGIPETRDISSPQGFPETALPYGGRLLCDPLGPASHAASPILAQSFSPVPNHHYVKAVALRTASRLSQPGVQMGLTSKRKVITTDASNSGWGALLEGNPAFSSLSAQERWLLTYQLPKTSGGFPGPGNLPTGHKGAPRPGPVRQHDSGSLHQLPRRSEVSHPSQDGSTPPILGTE